MTIKANLSGGCIALSALATGIGAGAANYPITGLLNPLARIVEALSPALFGAGLLFAILALLLGARRIGPMLALASIVCGVALYLDVRRVSQPVAPSAEADVRVLFFNVLGYNEENAEKIVIGAIAEQPDIIVFTEAGALSSQRERLEEHYRIEEPCKESFCHLTIATRLETNRFWRIKLANWSGKRYAVLDFSLPDGRQGYLAANHLLKPWVSGLIESEWSMVEAQYNYFDGPVAVVGDFNMAPWSLPMRQLLAQTGMRTTRDQPASWPIAAGRFGIPIDQLLVKGGMQVVKVTSFGAGMGSNHLGFVADLSLPAPQG